MTTEPRPLSHGLGAVVRSLQSGEAGTIRGVFGSWREIVGPMIAEHTTPMKIDGATLHVEVDQPAWATQVRFLEADLLTALRANGCGELRAISVRVAGVRRGTGSGRSGR